MHHIVTFLMVVCSAISLDLNMLMFLCSQCYLCLHLLFYIRLWEGAVFAFLSRQVIQLSNIPLVSPTYPPLCSTYSALFAFSFSFMVLTVVDTTCGAPLQLVDKCSLLYLYIISLFNQGGSPPFFLLSWWVEIFLTPVHSQPDQNGILFTGEVPYPDFTQPWGALITQREGYPFWEN